MKAAGESVFDVGPRRLRPQGRFDLLAGLGVALLATLAYLVALSARTLPDEQVAIVLFTAAPVLCLVALLVYRSRAAAGVDPAMRWAAAGLTVCFAALTLQFVSFPVVVTGGGLLRTQVESSAALYLWFHLALFLGALAGAFRLSPRLVGWFTWLGVAFAVALAANLVPLPTLIEQEVVFTPLLTRMEIVLAGIGLFAAVAWSASSGRRTTPLAGWFVVGLALSIADVVLNAATGARYDAVWWSSLSMRVATFAVLALGAVTFVLRDLRAMERYADAELSRREQQLAVTGVATDALMSNAVALSRADTPREVAAILCDSVVRLTGCQRVVVLHTRRRRPGMSVLCTHGYDADGRALVERLSSHPDSPPRYILDGGPAVFLVGTESVLGRFSALRAAPFQREVSRLAAVPLLSGGEVVGAVVATDDRPGPWTVQERAVLEALVAQGGPAMGRAAQNATERRNAEVLQRSLLPPALPVVPGLAVAVRYLPADVEAAVGGDWYDSVPLDDGRVVLAVGDVMGSGVRSASVMGVLRQSLRTLVRVESSPATVLEHLDDIATQLGDHALATMVVTVWDPTSRSLTFGRAGHPPPVVVDGDGSSRLLLEALSPPLGTVRRHRPESVVPMTPGSTLVLYTDGLLDERNLDVDEAVAVVEATAAEAIRAGEGVSGVADRVLAHRPMDNPDDVALLVARPLADRAGFQPGPPLLS